MNVRIRFLSLAVTAVMVTTGMVAGCSYSDDYPSVYGSVGVGTGYYRGPGYYGPWYGRPYPPMGGRPPGMYPPPSARPPRPMNPVARPPRPSRMPSIPSGPRPSLRR